MGDCYRHGYGVRRDANQAVYNYTKATKANIGMRARSQAHATLGDMYTKVEGLPKLQDKAMFHFMFAAERYNHEAQMRVGLMFEGDDLANRNLDRAIMYFKLSARGGNAQAHLKVEKYIELGHTASNLREMEVCKN